MTNDYDLFTRGLLFYFVNDSNKMTDSDNSQPQDDSDEDIYKDIPEFNFEDELAKLEGSKESYKQEANDLSEKVKALTEENKELKKSNEVLKRNLSTLLKTAQAEVQRKDSVIQELRNKVDSFTFKRNKNQTKDKYTSTNDLDLEVRYDLDKQKCFGNKKRSKSYENQTGSDNSEQKLSLDEEKRKVCTAGKEENCDTDRKSDYYRDNSETNFRHSEGGRGSYDRRREKKSSRYEGSSDSRRSYRENHRDHLKYDPFDKKRHSRSSDSRFLHRRRSSRERREERRRSSERRRRSEDSPRRRNLRKERSRSREKSRSKETPLEKAKTLDKDVRLKEQISGKPEAKDSGKGSTDEVEKKRSDQENGTKAKSKEKRSGKHEKRSSLDIFSTISPLDALYKEMVISRNDNRFSNSKPGANLQESDLEEGELSVTQTHLESSESQPDEDWTLSFKNERQNDAKPMTVYSRRMMKKFEVKPTENVEEEKKKPVECVKAKEVEKEPGELTDDENIVESSKEFQELTKVASIQSEIIENTCKEPVRVEQKPEIKPLEQVETAKEGEKAPTGKEAPAEEPSKEFREVIEFSPFKNNYKLIAISPIKPREKEHAFDFYSKTPQTDRNSSEGKQSKPADTSEDWKNSSSEKDSETELKIVIPPASESPKEKTSPEKAEMGRGKRRTSKKSSPEVSLKRKRKSDEEGKTQAKKRKVEKSEPRTRGRRNSKTEPETQNKPGEDIANFEFFKPAAKAEATLTPVEVSKSVCTTTDYKMTATMSVTGVVRLETPNKCVEKLKNLMINEQMIINVLDSKSNSQFSPLIGSRGVIDMTPRRMLKNDLMLTDSEDDSVIKRNPEGEEEQEEENAEEGEGEEEEEASGSENSDSDSDSGASDFVDLL